MTFPRVRVFFLAGLVIYQLSLFWWIPALDKLPILFSNIGAYIAMQAGNVELAERLYAFRRESDGTSFAVFSTYALVNRGSRRADDPRIDDAIRKVYGEKSPEMHERKRLLADFILMTQGNVPEVEKLRTEARAIDPKKYTWKRNFVFWLDPKIRFQEAYFYDLPNYREKILNCDPVRDWTPPPPGGPGLVGAPIDPRYGNVVMDIPNISCWPYPLEADGSAATTLRKYDFEFFDNRNVEYRAISKALGDLLLRLIPLSLLLELILLETRKRLFNYLCQRWQSELFASDTDLSDKLQAGNSLIALERLRKNIDRADAISFHMLNLVEKMDYAQDCSV